MKRLIFLVFVLFTIQLSAQMNPDGYIGGLSISVKGLINDQRDLQKNPNDMFFGYEVKIKAPINQWMTVSVFYSGVRSKQYYTSFNSYINSGVSSVFNNPQYGLEFNFYIKRIF